MKRIWLLRHGETEWSISGQHTGRTDIPLTDEGTARAVRAGARLAQLGAQIGRVHCSPLIRAQQTAQAAGYSTFALDDDLQEWDYGEFEGRTTAAIRADRGEPGWLIWDCHIGAGGTPGEQPEEVAARARRVIDRCLAEDGDCLLVAHGHLLRILAATWLGLPPRGGRLLALDPGSISALGFEREQRVLTLWNS